MNSHHITHELTSHLGLFPYRRYLCVENVSWGLLPWEADLVCMAEGSGYLTEVEIKISHADLKNDFAKDKHTRMWPNTGWPLLRRFYYAVTADVHRLATKAGTWDRAPPHAGIIVANQVKFEPHQNRLDVVRCDVVRPAKTLHGRTLRDGERYDLARLGVMRYWTRQHPGEVTDDNRLPGDIDTAEAAINSTEAVAA